MAGVIEDAGKAADALEFGVDQLLVGLPVVDRIKIVENIFLTAAKANNDDMALRWLQIYENVSCKAYATARNFLIDIFPHWLIKLHMQVLMMHASLAGFVPIVPTTRHRMLEKIIVGWTPKKDPRSNAIFEFIMKEVMRTSPHDVGPIHKLIREHTSSEFTPELLEEWMNCPDIPDEVMKILAIAWVRNGGWQSVSRYRHAMNHLDFYERIERVRNNIKKYTLRARDGGRFNVAKVLILYETQFQVAFTLHIMGDCDEGNSCEVFSVLGNELRKLWENQLLQVLTINVVNADGVIRHHNQMGTPR